MRGRQDSGCAREWAGRGKGGATAFGCELRINSPGLRSTGGVTAAARKREDVLKDLNLNF